MQRSSHVFHNTKACIVPSQSAMWSPAASIGTLPKPAIAGTLRKVVTSNHGFRIDHRRCIMQDIPQWRWRSRPGPWNPGGMPHTATVYGFSDAFFISSASQTSVADRVLADEPSDLGVVVPGSVVVQPGFGVPLPARVGFDSKAGSRVPKGRHTGVVGDHHGAEQFARPGGQRQRRGICGVSDFRDHQQGRPKRRGTEMSSSMSGQWMARPWPIIS